jgi:hypothetical protein
MSENRCFLLSCYALRIEAEYTELSPEKKNLAGSTYYQLRIEPKEDDPVTHSVFHTSALAVARSIEEAKSLAREHFLIQCPEAEGCRSFNPSK